MDNSSALNTFGERQQALLRLLLRSHSGLTVDKLAEQLGITRTAVNQHLKALTEGDYIAHGSLRESGGRPSRAYLITSKGIDLFPKQYSWFSSLVLAKMRCEKGTENLCSSFREMASSVADTLLARLKGKTLLSRLTELEELMLDLGYETTVAKDSQNRLPIIEAHNCVYHNLALDYPEVCEFDLQLLSELSGAEVQHEECMVRGGACCRFRFKSKN